MYITEKNNRESYPLTDPLSHRRCRNFYVFLLRKLARADQLLSRRLRVRVELPPSAKIRRERPIGLFGYQKSSDRKGA